MSWRARWPTGRARTPGPVRARRQATTPIDRTGEALEARIAPKGAARPKTSPAAPEKAGKSDENRTAKPAGKRPGAKGHWQGGVETHVGADRAAGVEEQRDHDGDFALADLAGRHDFGQRRGSGQGEPAFTPVRRHIAQGLGGVGNRCFRRFAAADAPGNIGNADAPGIP